MELRLILKILLRRWWLELLPPILVGAYTVITYQPPATTYATTLRFSVGYTPQQETTTLYDRFYPAWLTSEYIAGGLSDWAKTGDFAQTVAEDATSHGHAIAAPEVAGSITSDHLRSIVVLYLNGGDQEKLTAIASSAAHVFQTRNGVVFPQNGPSGATVTPLDTPAVAPALPSLRSRLDIPIRIGLALALGIALAFAAHYFDPCIRDRQEVEALGLTIVGEIPK